MVVKGAWLAGRPRTDAWGWAVHRHIWTNGLVPQLGPRQCRVDTPERLVSPQEGDAFEDSGRNGGSGDRHPYRLEHVLGLGAPALDHAAQRRFDVLDVEGLRRRQRVAGLDQG